MDGQHLRHRPPQSSEPFHTGQFTTLRPSVGALPGSGLFAAEGYEVHAYYGRTRSLNLCIFRRFLTDPTPTPCSRKTYQTGRRPFTLLASVCYIE